MTVRLSKVAREFNVGLSTIVEFLQKKGFEIEAEPNPNAKITEEQLIQMMEEETFLTPDECLAYGFIDEVGRKQAEPEDPEDPEDPENPENPEDPENPQEPDKEEELSQRLRGIGLMALKEQARKRQEFIRIIQKNIGGIFWRGDNQIKGKNTKTYGNRKK